MLRFLQWVVDAIMHDSRRRHWEVKRLKTQLAQYQEAERTLARLEWLIAAGHQITMGAVEHQGGAEFRLTLDMDRPIQFFGDISQCLTDARFHSERLGITP